MHRTFIQLTLVRHAHNLKSYEADDPICIATSQIVAIQPHHMKDVPGTIISTTGTDDDGLGLSFHVIEDYDTLVEHPALRICYPYQPPRGLEPKT